uniref:BUB1 N-terminal domain-containing protein n=1 Tax=Elaeophora elaphi TaxID=1147741 RepID=A0A0R3RHH7_9BILA
MDLLDQIAIFRGCEPSVIISYIAIVREVYLHACTNLKKEDISVQERKRKMLEHWQQIEKHFAKIKYAMLDCWPIGNESDLMAAYVSIALLYSLYKDVCDERIIRQCYEAAEHARKCDRANLSESQFNEVQQYCDMIENIFFLRRQRSAMNNGKIEYVNNSVVNDDQLDDNDDIDSDNHRQLDSQQQLTPTAEASIDLLKCAPDNPLNCHHSILGRIKDGPAILAEYGKLTSAGKTPASEKLCQKRLRPSDFEIKTTQKKLKYQKPKNSATISTEFEAALLARNAVGNGEFEFPRPSDLKLNRNLGIFKSPLNSRYCGRKSKLPDICPTTAENLGSIEINPQNLNSYNSVHQVLESSPVSPIESQSFVKQKGEKMASVQISGSSQAIDTNPSSCIQHEVSETKSKKIGEIFKHTQTNVVFPKLEFYVNEFVEKIIHSVMKMNEESRVHITDNIVTSTLLTSSNCEVPAHGSVVMLNDGCEEVGVGTDGMNKNILIRTKQILNENINQQIEDVIIQSVAKTIAAGVIIDPNSDDMLRRDKYSSEMMSDKMIVVEDYAEMELSHNQIPESFCNMQQTSNDTADSDLSFISPRAKLSILVPSESTRDGKKIETNSVVAVPEERNKKEEKMHKVLDGKDEIETSVIPNHLSETKKIIRGAESNEKFEASEIQQKLETSKQQQLAVNETTSIVAKFSLKQIENDQTDPHYVLENDKQKEYITTASKFFVSKGDIFSGIAKNVSNSIWRNNGVVTNYQICASTGQMKANALIYPSSFNCSSDNPPMQQLNYTPEMSLIEIIPDVNGNLVEISEKSDRSQVKSQNESLNKDIFFEKYANFEPPSCRLHKAPEFDAVPLSTEQLLSKSRLQFQMFLAESTISDQEMRHHYSMSDSTKKMQSITEEIDNCKAVLKSFSNEEHSSSSQTGLKTLKVTDVNTAQTELMVEAGFQEQQQQYRALLTPNVVSLTSSSSQVTTSNSESITPPRTNQESIVTEFENNERIASKPDLKETSDREFSFASSNSSKCDEHEQIQLNSKIQQIGLRRPQIAPPRPPPRQRLYKPSEAVSSKPPLLRRLNHLFTTKESASETSFTFSESDDKKSGFSKSEICQASSSQETGLFSISEEKLSELEKPWNDEETGLFSISEEKSSELEKPWNDNTISKEKQRSKISSKTNWDLENKLVPCKERSDEEMNNNKTIKTSSTPVEIIQIPHFDAKAEFDRRFSVKKSCPGEVPVIVKSAILKSNSKLRLSKCLTDELLISPTLRLSASEKPDFNFIIRNE